MSGIIVGTSSFIFIASPIVQLLDEKRLRPALHEVAIKKTQAAQA